MSRADFDDNGALRSWQPPAPRMKGVPALRCHACGGLVSGDDGRCPCLRKRAADREPASRMSTTLMTSDELQREADALARRIAGGTTTIGDSTIVIELANRLLRATPAFSHFEARSESGSASGPYRAVAVDTLGRDIPSMQWPAHA